MTCSPDRTSDNSYGFKMKVFENVRLCIGTIIPDNISIVKKWKNKRFIMPICVASTSVSAISETPWNTAWGLLRSWHDVPVLFQNPAWQAQTDTAVSLWVSRAKYQFRLRNSSWPFCSDSPAWRSRHMVTWFGRHGDAFGMTENAFFRAFITLSSQFHLHSSFSASFNGNRVKKSPLTLDLSFKSSVSWSWTTSGHGRLCWSRHAAAGSLRIEGKRNNSVTERQTRDLRSRGSSNSSYQTPSTGLRHPSFNHCRI